MAMKARTWNGLTIQDKVNRAAGRAIIGIGMTVAVETKRVTHVVTGTLRRSVHMAPPGQIHEDDERIAAGTDMLLSETAQPVYTPMGPVIEVGSWLPYACVEWVGRMHPGITQGMEVSRGARADAIVAQAFREEGL